MIGDLLQRAFGLEVHEAQLSRSSQIEFLDEIEYCCNERVDESNVECCCCNEDCLSDGHENTSTYVSTVYKL